ncbi:MAG: hypothetical protein KDH09_14955 [Chrysiogenetes bacterium]|nr:hypothetical protein [Chrysiogenetes bacterium]
MWAFLPKKLPKPPPTFEELAARATVQVAISRTGCFVRNQMRSRLAFFLASGRWRPAERAVLLYFSLPAAISNVILLRGFHDEGVYWSARDCIDDERTDLGWRVGERARRRFRLALREWELLHLLRAFLVWLGHFGVASRDFVEETEEHSRGPPPKESGWYPVKRHQSLLPRRRGSCPTKPWRSRTEGVLRASTLHLLPGFAHLPPALLR